MNERFANPYAFKNFMRLVRAIHKKNPNATKEQIRFGIYSTRSDLFCGVLDMRAPKCINDKSIVSRV